MGSGQQIILSGITLQNVVGGVTAGGGAPFSQLTSSQNASREDADEEETESFFGNRCEGQK